MLVEVEKVVVYFHLVSWLGWCEQYPEFVVRWGLEMEL
jgi:hypothetical protein